MNKLLISIIAVAVIVGGGAFFGGMKYAETRSPQGKFLPTNFQNLSPEERLQRLQQLGPNAGGGSQRGGRFVAGKIISKDEKSVTIKLRDGGSKIVFISDATEITKSAQGSLSDLEIGKTYW